MARMTIFRSDVLLLAACLTAAAGPAVAVAQGAPPSTHTVKTGDTLWGLAREYFGDPFLWPEIYRLNTQVVEDPHWIYPGEVLQLSGIAAAVPATETPAPTTAEAPPPAAGAPTEPAAAPESTAAPAAAPAPADTSAQAPAQPEEEAAPSEEPASVLEAQPEQELSESAMVFPQYHPPAPRATLKLDLDRAYRPLRRSEFYSSGFLTEGQSLPYGKVIGPVTPSQIRSFTTNNTAHLYTKVAVTAPPGASYQVGDTLLLVRLDRRLQQYGDVVVPTGMARVLDASRKEITVEIIREFGAIRGGQLTLPAEKFVPGGNSKAVPISDGLEGRLIGPRDEQDLVGPQDVVFIDKGRKEGVAPGDLFELRRSVARQEGRAGTIPEVMATLQIVHVRDHTATARVLTVTSPDIPAGTRVRQIAKLPT